MKIKQILHDHHNQTLCFDDGTRILIDTSFLQFHQNYADFEQLDRDVYDVEFDSTLKFEPSENGFKFGNPEKMIFVPCYSMHHGLSKPNPYIDIYIHQKENGKERTYMVLKQLKCELVIDL